MAQALTRAGAQTVITSRDGRPANDCARRLSGDATLIAMDVRD